MNAIVDRGLPALRRNLPPRMFRTLRRTLIRLGLSTPPPFQYPFWETMEINRMARPHYLWGTLCAAFHARQLGLPAISVIEFGVAGGNGLVALEGVAHHVELLSGVRIEVYGFDTGTGLTRPTDYRDLPQLWGEGFFGMDVEQLRRRLKRAKLILGPVAETVPEFVKSSTFAPVGFIAFDLDMYSSTMHAFGILRATPEHLLPRAICYFDDIFGFSHGDLNGERLAIREFNAENPRAQLSPIYGLRYVLNLDQGWTQMMYMLHALDHPRYCDYDGSNPVREIPLKPA